jgi:hypothetical protein
VTPRCIVAALLAAITTIASACAGPVASLSPSPSGSSEATTSPTGATVTPTPIPWPARGPGGCAITLPNDPVGRNLLMAEPLWFATCYQLAGVVNATGGFVGYDDNELLPVTSCDEWATGQGGTTLSAPVPTTGITVLGGNLYVSLPIGPYKGPGSYPSIHTSSPAGLSEDVSSSPPGEAYIFDFVEAPFIWNPSAAASAEVAANGSGSITLSHLAAAGFGVNGQVPHDVGEAFTQRWTCMVNPGLG